ncbi:MAG: 5-formyltetrahydrofolate cyclo-ligase [Thermoguttaceae bacterium]|nr:5-formyltetrahydrofolate cyclo-ligase [Thermoguttaceae bacterium]
MTDPSTKPIDKPATAPDVALQKKRLRAEIKSRLQTLSYDREQIADALFVNLSRVEQFRSAKVVGCYVDFQLEAPTRPLLLRFFDARDNLAIRTVGVPYCVGQTMRFHRLATPKVDLKTREILFPDLEPVPPYGILEPSEQYRLDPGRAVAPETIDALIVPGLAFDSHGRRLGRGAGYYDRYLPLLRSDALVAGVCFDEQLVDKTPTDERDVRVDVVITPTRAIYAN